MASKHSTLFDFFSATALRPPAVSLTTSLSPCSPLLPLPPFIVSPLDLRVLSSCRPRSVLLFFLFFSFCFSFFVSKGPKRSPPALILTRRPISLVWRVDRHTNQSASATSCSQCNEARGSTATAHTHTRARARCRRRLENCESQQRRVRATAPHPLFQRLYLAPFRPCARPTSRGPAHSHTLSYSSSHCDQARGEP